MIRHSTPATTAAGAMLLLVIALVPLPLGGIPPLARSSFEALAFLAFAAALWSRRARPALGVVARPCLALAGIGLLGFLQAAPWPGWWLGLASPRIAESWQSARELAGHPELAGHLSLAPAVSRRVALGWLAVAATLAAAAVVGGERRQRRLLSGVWITVVVFAVFYGADNLFAGRTTVWGLTLPGDASRLRGTFINPNHFAFYLNLAVVTCFAWLWWAVRRARESPALERRLLLVVAPGLVFTALGVGLVLTGSRGGLLAAVLGIAAQSLLLAGRHRRWSQGALGIATLGLGLAAIVLFGLGQGVLDRWLQPSAFEVVWGSRLRVYLESLHLWLAFPILGSGLGTFRQAFPKVQPAEPAGTWTHAHSDLLELLVTGGLVAAVLLVWGLVPLLRRLWRVCRRGRRSEDRAAGLAALGALAAAIAHSAVDFSLTVPANALTLALLCGMAAGAATFERELSPPAADAPDPG